jgi:glycerol-3-phosphate cytidylyltransferase
MLDSKPEIGVIAGNFDVIHPGYIELFKEINNSCQKQYILLHDDPTIERPYKLKPILSVEERKEMLKYFFTQPTFLSYNTESELLVLLRSSNPNIRFLGDDYIGKDYTGKDLEIPVKWVDRSHGWSTTKFKKSITDSICK